MYDIPPEKIVSHPIRESVRLLASAAKVRGLTEHEIGWASVDAIYQDLDLEVSSWLDSAPDVRAVYCYEDGALSSFEKAKATGRKSIYELPIAYWQTARELLSRQAQMYPEWADTLVGTDDSQTKLARKTREIELADAVICPSDFVLQSIPPEIRENKRCVVAHFGSPTAQQPLVRKDMAAPTLKVLFAGSMTQRKGLADVFAAFKLLNDRRAELIVFGSPIVDLDFYKKQFDAFTWAAPRPQGEVLELMSQCDVLLLPSIVEGRALVQQEAMVSGLPLIISPNTGGTDLVEEGKTGFVVPINSPESIADRINWFIENRDKLPDMRIAAREKAAMVTWRNYQDNVLNLIRSLL